MNPLETIKKKVHWASNGCSFVAAVVVESKGSSPRKAGARMLISATESIDTIGGGSVEADVIDAARIMLKERHGPKLIEFDLSGAKGPVCGGKMQVFLEPWYSPEKVVVVGAGHVSQKLCPMLMEVGFSVVVIDNRPQLLSLSAFEGAIRIEASFSKVKENVEFYNNLFMVVMTPEHKYDFDVVESCIGEHWYYFGVMASRHKAAKLVEHLKSKNTNEQLIHKLNMPIGVKMKCETPSEIAVSICAELINKRAESRK